MFGTFKRRVGISPSCAVSGTPTHKQTLFELEEWAKIEDNANSLGMTTSDYIRRMTLNGKIVKVDLSGIMPFINGMRTVSNNINQIARKANETHSVHAVDVMQMRKKAPRLGIYDVVIDKCEVVSF